MRSVGTLTADFLAELTSGVTHSHKTRRAKRSHAQNRQSHNQPFHPRVPRRCVQISRTSFGEPGLTLNIAIKAIDLFRGACAVKGNVQVAGHVKPALFSRRDVTLGDVDGSLFHIKI